MEGLEGDRFVVYEHFSGKYGKAHPDGEVPVNLPKFGAAVYSIVPYSNDSAPIGLLDKYISPAVITSKSCVGNKLELTLRDGGRFGVYMDNEPSGVIMNGNDVIKPKEYVYENNLLVLDLPTVGGNMYGSRGQSVVLLTFVGVCCIILGILEFQEKDRPRAP